MQSRRHQGQADDRRRDLAAIHIGRKALAWSEDEYRDIMATVCGGIRSAGDLDSAGRKRFLAHIQACAVANAGGARPARQRKPLPPKQALAWSLWMQLADAGKVQQRTMASLEGFAKRQTGVDAFSWLNRHQTDLVIESLKKWLKREQDPTA